MELPCFRRDRLTNPIDLSITQGPQQVGRNDWPLSGSRHEALFNQELHACARRGAHFGGDPPRREGVAGSTDDLVIQPGRTVRADLLVDSEMGVELDSDSRELFAIVRSTTLHHIWRNAPDALA